MFDVVKTLMATAIWTTEYCRQLIFYYERPAAAQRTTQGVSTENDVILLKLSQLKRWRKRTCDICWRRRLRRIQRRTLVLCCSIWQPRFCRCCWSCRRPLVLTALLLHITVHLTHSPSNGYCACAISMRPS